MKFLRPGRIELGGHGTREKWGSPGFSLWKDALRKNLDRKNVFVIMAAAKQKTSQQADLTEHPSQNNGESPLP